MDRNLYANTCDVCKENNCERCKRGTHHKKRKLQPEPWTPQAAESPAEADYVFYADF